jgi:thiamine transport system permease protein
MAVAGANATGEANISVTGCRRHDAGPGETLANGLLLALAGAFVAAPIISVIASGLAADLGRLASEPSVQRAAGTSLALAAISAVLAVALAWSFVSVRAALAARRRSGRAALAERAADLGPLAALVVPPIVIGAGWFVLLRQTGGVFAAAPSMVAATNAVMAMPFAMRVLRPAHDAAALRHDRLAAQLGITGWTRLRLIDWPALRRPLAVALAFAAALSLGDLGVIALFGSESVKTLPYLLMERMGAYRTADAAGLALFLALLCLGLVAIADRLGRIRA